MLRVLSSGVSQCRSRRARVARSCYHAQPLPIVQMDRAGCPARQHTKRWPPVGRTPESSWAMRPITYLTGGLSAPYAARMYWRAGLRKYGHLVSNRLRHAFVCVLQGVGPTHRGVVHRQELDCPSAPHLHQRSPEPSTVLNKVDSPYTVSVYPIEQEPGVWFATYLINEYRDGTERLLANVSMRHNVHGTEALARNAARLAGRAAIARLTRRHTN
ncbi:hypothetical protein LMG6871_01295 [Ralstonia edaphis]|nr:hypothetical protein LMG6871_01295 [Ralstonia sp. LMG 6871]